MARGAPVSDRHRAGARNPHRRPRSKWLPSRHVPLKDPMARGALASSPGGGLRPGSRGSAKPAPMTPFEMAPLATRPPQGPDGAWSAGQLSRWGPPTGIARERETRTNDPWSAGLRPASRGSAKPAPTTRGAPVSDRHRAGARNPHRRPVERRSPTGIARERETRTDDPIRDSSPLGAYPLKDPMARERRSPTGIAWERETSADDAWSAGLRPASRGSAKPAPTTRGALASSPGGGLRPASRGSAKPAPMTLCHANVRAASFHDGRGCAGGPDHVSLSVPPNSAPTSPCQRFPGTIGTKATPPWS